MCSPTMKLWARVRARANVDKKNYPKQKKSQKSNLETVDSVEMLAAGKLSRTSWSVSQL